MFANTAGQVALLFAKVAAAPFAAAAAAPAPPPPPSPSSSDHHCCGGDDHIAVDGGTPGPARSRSSLSSSPPSVMGSSMLGTLFYPEVKEAPKGADLTDSWRCLERVILQPRLGKSPDNSRDNSRGKSLGTAAGVSAHPLWIGDNKFVALRVEEDVDKKTGFVAHLQKVFAQFPPHANIVRFYGAFGDSGVDGAAKKFRSAVFEFGGRPAVTEINRHAGEDGPPLPSLVVRLNYCRQLTNAVAHLHAHGVVHGDIRISNVLFTGHRLTLKGFSKASMFDEEAKRRDVAALGRVLRQILGWKLRPSDLSDVDVSEQVRMAIKQCGKDGGPASVADVLKVLNTA